VFSQFANTKLKVGQALEVGTPEGKLLFEPRQIAKKIPFVSGSGITPVCRLLNQ
jgi:ring-1,2-phenylacetyl-CoA epoxidase subunit PaaE